MDDLYHDSPLVLVQHADERARVYGAGGIGFDHKVKGVGWCVCDRPSRLIFQLAVAVRQSAFPALSPIS